MSSFLFQKNAAQNLKIEDQFYPHAKKLRTSFENRFANPLHASSDRFCWDYWLVPNQYRLLRTPAAEFFGDALFQPFLSHLLAWGRSQLGCQMISHPWLSVYLDGCHQALHSDVPHGPWSFVYSLTPWANRTFKGGRTILARPKLLRYFEEISHDRSDETSEFFQFIEPKMNRLTLVDPRYPQGEERVEGAEELNQARVVIHGWFTEPRPMLEGALSFKKISTQLDQFALGILSKIEKTEHTGLLSLRLKINSSGKIDSTTVLTSHLINSSGEVLAPSLLKKSIEESSVVFPKSSGPTFLTLPIEFKR